MDSFGPLLKAFVETPLPALCVLLLLAVGWLVRDRFQANAKREADLTAALAAANGAIEELHKARLADVMQIVPLTQKLITVVELVTAARGVS